MSATKSKSIRSDSLDTGETFKNWRGKTRIKREWGGGGRLTKQKWKPAGGTPCPMTKARNNIKKISGGKKQKTTQ